MDSVELINYELKCLYTDGWNQIKLASMLIKPSTCSYNTLI